MSKFRVVTDSSYTGGLSWLITNFDAVVEPTGEFVESNNEESNEVYEVSFDSIDGAELLDGCDAVIEYEEI